MKNILSNKNNYTIVVVLKRAIQDLTQRRYSIVFCLTFLLIVIQGCKKFVEVGAPQTMTTTPSVFSSVSTATSAMTSIYVQMFKNSESFTLAQHTGLSGDELTEYSTFPFYLQLYGDQVTSAGASGVSTYGPWVNAYSYIYQSNAIIEGLATNKGVSNNASQQLIGEAKFIRAFWFFYLINIYGDVPLTLTTNYTKNQFLSRTSTSAVYNQIIIDLEDAEQKLNSNYVDITDTTSTSDRVRPNKSTAATLLARVYLYKKDYSNAAVEATKVIANSEYKLCVNLDSCFLVNNSEAIWQIATPLPTSVNTYDGYNFILTTQEPGSTGANHSEISPQLYNSFETGDQRQKSWMGTFVNPSNPTVTYYYPYKYKIFNGSNITEYTTVFRLAEVYLIRAEALIQNGDLTGINDLNKVRARAGLQPTTASAKDELLAAILHERQVELFCEWGHRWFDLKRTGQINTVMSTVVPQKTTGGTWSANAQLYPIPSTEIALDPNLTQNPGY